MVYKQMTANEYENESLNLAAMYEERRILNESDIYYSEWATDSLNAAIADLESKIKKYETMHGLAI